MKHSPAFSLVEVVIALAVATFALVAILALLPVGLQSGNSAVGDTRSALIAEDMALRLRATSGTYPGSPTAAAGTVISALVTTNYYDVNGRYLGTYSSNAYTNANAFYSVYANRKALNSYPTNSNPLYQDANNAYSSQLEAAVISVGWPVNTATGALPSTLATTNTYTFYVRVTPNL